MRQKGWFPTDAPTEPPTPRFCIDEPGQGTRPTEAKPRQPQKPPTEDEATKITTTTTTKTTTGGGREGPDLRNRKNQGGAGARPTHTAPREAAGGRCAGPRLSTTTGASAPKVWMGGSVEPPIQTSRHRHLLSCPTGHHPSSPLLLIPTPVGSKIMVAEAVAHDAVFLGTKTHRPRETTNRSSPEPQSVCEVRLEGSQSRRAPAPKKTQKPKNPRAGKRAAAHREGGNPHPTQRPQSADGTGERPRNSGSPGKRRSKIIFLHKAERTATGIQGFCVQGDGLACERLDGDDLHAAQLNGSNRTAAKSKVIVLPVKVS